MMTDLGHDRPTEEATLDPDATDRDRDGGMHPDGRDPERGTDVAQRRFGRYVFVKQLGAGGMGVVYLAYDPELDRRVAIKVLRGSDDVRATRRLSREATAMARLDHPNIVSVHDVGWQDGQLYVAMEYVRGETLDAWIESERPSWRAIVDAHAQAAKGLAAAHEAGLVHRDVKPSNILCGADGRVRVLDLGLATIVGEDSDAKPSHRTTLEGLDPRLSVRLTRAGAIIGTPGYMAPEQFEGDATDPRIDQFGLCASLYQSLYGQLPYPGETPAALCFAVLEGQLSPRPAGTAVPKRIHAAITRGLATNPEDRFASMAALIDRLRWDPSRRWWVLVSTVAASLLIATAMLEARRASTLDEPRCLADPALLDGVWDPVAKRRVERAFSATEARDAAAVSERVIARMDLLALAWLEGHRDACEATHVRRVESESMLDQRMRCLASAKERIAATAAILATADASVVEASVSAVPERDFVDRCADSIRVTGGFPAEGSDAERNEHARIEAELVRGELAQTVGRHREALERAIEARTSAERADWTIGIARALLLEGISRTALGETELAIERLHEAAARADAVHDDETRARALIELVWLTGYELGQDPLARGLGAQASGVLVRLGGAMILESDLHANLGALALARGDFDEARRLLSSAIESRVPATDANDPTIATLRSNLANVLLLQGDAEAAVGVQRQAVASLLEAHGEAHPDFLGALNNLGAALIEAAEFDEALAVHERSLALRTRVHGDDDIRVANALNGVGLALLGLGRPGAARPHFERSLVIRGDRDGRLEDRAEAMFGLARAIVDSDPSRSRTLAAQALSMYGEMNGREPDFERVQAFLAMGESTAEDVRSPPP
jgi:eukaryotic-like serine/threonine-protein kinase